MGDMNAKVDSVEIGGVIGKWVIEGVNENVHYLVEICAERGLFPAYIFLSAQVNIHVYVGKGE